MRTAFPALPLLALFTGCVVTATQPPDPGAPEPQPAATATATETAADTTTDTATATETATDTATETATDTATDTAAPSSPGAGQHCGSRGHQPCPSGHFCDYAKGDPSKGSLCGATDIGGICTPIPQVCTREFRQVCGCNGKTYSNPCAANAAGTSVKKLGACDG